MHKRLRALVPAVAATAAASVIVLGSGATSAVAAENYTLAGYQFRSDIFGSTPKDGAVKKRGAELMNLTLGGQEVAQVYCIDIHQYTTNEAGAYSEGDWATAGIQNLPKVQWILNNSFPTLDAQAIAKAAGLAGLNKVDATAATQAAIWHYTDGFELAENNRPNVKKVYAYLVDAAAKAGGDAQNSTAISMPTGSFKAGDKISGIKVTTTDGSAAKVTLSDPTVELHYAADNSKVDLSAVKSGAEMYFTAPSATGSLTITAAGTFHISSGRVFVASGHQTLIVAKPGGSVSTAIGTVTWTQAPTTSTSTTTATETTTVTETVTNTIPAVTTTITGPTSTTTVTGTATVTETITVPGPTKTPETPTSTSTTSTDSQTTSPKPTDSETTSPKPTDTLPQTETPTGTVTESTSDTTTTSDTTQPAPTATEEKPHTPPLAQTGANIIGAALGALALIGAGVMFVVARRKKANG